VRVPCLSLAAAFSTGIGCPVISHSLEPLLMSCLQFRFRRKFWKWRKRLSTFQTVLESSERSLNILFDICFTLVGKVNLISIKFDLAIYCIF
jgi:hypothetical protein